MDPEQVLGIGTLRCVGRFAELIAASAGSLSRAAGRGGGTSLPGLMLNKLDPSALARLGGELGGGAVYISATNGKTTTARLLSACLRADGRDVTANAAGANLASGVTTALLARERRRRRQRISRAVRAAAAEAKNAGCDQNRLPSSSDSHDQAAAEAKNAGCDQNRSTGPGSGCGGIGVFEVDEAALVPLVGELRPRLLVLMNLFRDQLDRYGELEAIAERWAGLVRSSLSQNLGPNTNQPGGRVTRRGSGFRRNQGLGPNATLLLNADDPALAHLGTDYPNVVLFGIDDPSIGRPDLPHAADTVRCGACTDPLSYDLITVGHLGHWRCKNCGLRRPQPHISARRVHLEGLDRLALTITGIDGPDSADLEVSAGLGGLHNAYNVTAAAAAAAALGVEPEATRIGIAGVQAAFGRAEQVALEGRTLRLLLAKNPTGANENIQCLLAEPAPLQLLVVLNDRTADGRDPSWIWDVDFEALWGHIGRVTLAGDRCWELALRFSYGGLSPDRFQVCENLPEALDSAVAATPPGGVLYALPTYTALLDLRTELVHRRHTHHFWHEQ